MKAESVFWPDRDPNAWVFTDSVRMTLAEFNRLRDVDPHKGGMAYERYKLRIARDGRFAWHLVARQYSFGQATFYAQKIIITLERD